MWKAMASLSRKTSEIVFWQLSMSLLLFGEFDGDGILHMLKRVKRIRASDTLILNTAPSLIAWCIYIHCVALFCPSQKIMTSENMTKRKQTEMLYRFPITGGFIALNAFCVFVLMCCKYVRDHEISHILLHCQNPSILNWSIRYWVYCFDEATLAKNIYVWNGTRQIVPYLSRKILVISNGSFMGPFKCTF